MNNKCCTSEGNVINCMSIIETAYDLGILDEMAKRVSMTDWDREIKNMIYDAIDYRTIYLIRYRDNMAVSCTEGMEMEDA